MKLYIDYKINDSGKGKFLARLIPCLENLGVKCSFDDKEADVALGVRRWRSKLKMPKVLRVDGIHMSKDKTTYYKNNLTKNSIKKSNAVIWQSRFCKDIIIRAFKLKPKKDFVIFNGANPDDYNVKSIIIDNKKHVIMSARWKDRPWKRLKDCVKVAKEVRKHEDIIFLIAGKVNSTINESGIKTLGYLNEEILRRYLVGSDAMLNLSYYDWCPNAMVEALCAGVPVVCNNASGAKELIDPESCEVVNCDSERKSKIRNRDKPPHVDPVTVSEALLRVLHSGKRANVPHLHIETIAQQYKTAFESVLK